MNDFFDKLGAAAKRAADSVGTEVSVAAEEQKIRTAYQALGKLYYKAVREHKDLTGSEFAEQCARVDAALKHIYELRDHKDVTGHIYADEEDFVTVE